MKNTLKIEPAVSHCPSGLDEQQPIPISLAIVETDFAELEDGSLVEMIEDPEDPKRSLLAIWKEGVVHLTDRFQYKSRVLVPIPRDRHVVTHVRLPQGAKTYESVSALLEQIQSIFSQCSDLDAEYITLLAHFVLSTWVIDQLSVAPYIALVGLPGSGKSSVLKILNLLCRRALLTADITPAAYYRVCDRLTPTLLIDETGTAGDRRTLFHLLRTGTTRDVTAIRRDESFKTFGAKVISWTELPNDPALNSRCVLIPLQESRRVDLKEPSTPEIVRAAADIQKQLLQFRFDRYKKLSLPSIPGDERLHSRARDLYKAFALPVGEDTKACEWLVKHFAIAPGLEPRAIIAEPIHCSKDSVCVDPRYA